MMAQTRTWLARFFDDQKVTAGPNRAGYIFAENEDAAAEMARLHMDSASYVEVTRVVIGGAFGPYDEICWFEL